MSCPEFCKWTNLACAYSAECLVLMHSSLYFLQGFNYAQLQSVNSVTDSARVQQVSTKILCFSTHASTVFLCNSIIPLPLFAFYSVGDSGCTGIGLAKQAFRFATFFPYLIVSIPPNWLQFLYYLNKKTIKYFFIQCIILFLGCLGNTRCIVSRGLEFWRCICMALHI